MSAMRKGLAIAGVVLAVLAASIVGTMAIVDRHNACQCQDGTRVEGFSYAITGREAYCAERCQDHGGGRWIGDWLEHPEGVAPPVRP